MSTLEALAGGLPVVGIRESGTAAFVGPRVGKLTSAGDADELAAAIVAVSTWPLPSLRQECHATAADHYSWDQVLDHYMAVYRQTVDRRVRVA